MVFISKFPGVARPRTDVFNFILENRRAYPSDRVLYRNDVTNETLTLEGLVQQSRRFATVLVQEFQVKPHDVVAILCADSIMYPVYYFGVLAAGACVQLIPIQTELTHSDVSARLLQARTKVLITDSVMRPMAMNAAKCCLEMEVIIPWENPRWFNCHVPEYHSFHIDNSLDSQDHIAFFNRTSGSTGGKIKTVMTSHAHFIAVLESTLHRVPQNTDPDEDVWLSTLSLGFFINAKLNMGLNILLGIPVVLMEHPFGPEDFSMIPRYGLTFLFIPPPVASIIAGHKFTQSHDVSSVKWLLSAGASMNRTLQKTVSQKLNNVHFDLEWGTSETLLISIQTDGDCCPEGSSGRLVNGMEARVVDLETKCELGPGEPGEILVRNSAAHFAGYFNNEEANKNTFDQDGWFHSADFGYLDKENHVFITDRMKELIRVGSGYGVHISATDMEEVLLKHPAVGSVIVAGVPDDKTAIERATAFVVLAIEWVGRAEEAHRELLDFAATHLNGLRTLHGGIIIVDEFPVIGFKVNRRELKSIALSRLQVNL